VSAAITSHEVITSRSRTKPGTAGLLKTTHCASQEISSRLSHTVTIGYLLIIATFLSLSLSFDPGFAADQTRSMASAVCEPEMRVGFCRRNYAFTMRLPVYIIRCIVWASDCLVLARHKIPVSAAMFRISKSIYNSCLHPQRNVFGLDKCVETFCAKLSAQAALLEAAKRTLAGGGHSIVDSNRPGLQRLSQPPHP